MEFRHLEAFVAAVQTGSFTAASEHMHLSQPAVSQLIARLEQSIGEPLFIRHPRRLEMTERARAFLPVAYEILALRKAIVDKSSTRKVVRGHLRVGTSSSATTFLWATMLSAYSKQYPQVEMDIRSVSHTDQTREDLLRGKLDVGILPFPHGEARLDSIVLGNHTALLVCSPEHPAFNAGKLVDKDALGAHPFLLYEQGMNFRRLADDFFSRSGLVPNIAMQSNDTYLIRTMAEIGFGVAFLPNWAIVNELSSGTLVRPKIDTGNLTEQFGLARLKNQSSIAVDSFVRFCLDNRDLIPEIARKELPASWRHYTETQDS